LREIYDAPFALNIRGNIPDYEKPLTGIVGTRKPSGHGRKAAFALGFELGAVGFPVVSGLAYGIDGAAHEGNLSGGGHTVAVLGSGVDRVYPAGHKKLAAGIIGNGGCVISEYPCDAPPLRYHFPERNRIISGLCRTVVLVEAPEKSGALITADFALEQNRDVVIHRAGLNGPVSAGTRTLAENGAVVVENASDIFESWGFASNPGMRRDAGGSRITGAAVDLEAELTGDLVIYHGGTYRRCEWNPDKVGESA
jgi:DNA processing protein